MRKKLTLSFFLVVVVSISGVVILTRFGITNQIRTFIQTGGQQHIMEAAAELTQYYAENGTWDGASILLQRSDGQGPGHSGQGGGAGNAAGGMNQNLILSDANRQVIAISQGSGVEIGETLSEAVIANGIPLKSPDGKRVVGYLLSFGALRFTQAEQNFLIERLTLAAALAGGAGGVIALVLGFFLAHRLLQPVRQLTGAARRLGDGDLSQRVPITSAKGGGDELVGLARTFNAMADSLQEAQSARQAMTADIAHELRTPLAIQRANLEALQDGIYPLNTDNLIPLLEQNHLLSRLVEDLRTLALSDAGQLNLERTPTDLIDFVMRVVSRFQAAADASQVCLELDLPPAGSTSVVNIDPLRLEQVLNNLLANALRHTPPEGHILVRIRSDRAENDNWLVQIEDSGPGIPGEALHHIFDRFYRADKSRSRKEGGSGLGLTIARDLMRAHDGELTAANLPEGGAQFTLHIPASQSV